MQSTGRTTNNLGERCSPDDEEMAGWRDGSLYFLARGTGSVESIRYVGS